MNTAFNGEPAGQAASQESAPSGQIMRLYVRGLRDTERALLASVIRLSQRDTRNRSQPLQLVEDAIARDADVLLVDARDPDALAWARQQNWLNDKPVIWLDATSAPAAHTTVRRPLQWPVLPVLLARAVDQFTPPAQALSAPVGDRPASAARILVVDDSEVVRSQLRGLLERQGCSITEASDVSSALATANTGAIDCVFMDVVMPGADGYEGCREIKKLQRHRVLPVVMLTSKSSPFDRIRGRMAGCDAYLAKPVDGEELKQVLARILSTGREGSLSGGPGLNMAAAT